MSRHGNAEDFTHGRALTQGRIFAFWFPLAATWLMMAAEGPFLAAVIARLPEPTFNLAAYGVAYALALLTEAPVIMLMSASTALVRDRLSYLRMRRFTYALCGGVTAAMLLLVVPAVFFRITEGLIDLPPEVARLTYQAVLVLLPWPGAIGYRRFYQGILIRFNRTRRVAYGTGVRLGTMAATAFGLYFGADVPGVVVGAAALSAGVVAEALAGRWMAAELVRELRAQEDPAGPALGYRRIARFYWPLAMTSVIGLTTQPVITFFLGQSRMAVESLAVLPVVNALVFLFRSLGLSWQEVGIALLGEEGEHYRELRRFALGLGLAASGALGLVAFSPLFDLWYGDLSGLTPVLAELARLPTQLLVLMPALSVLLSSERALLVHAHRTTPITAATAVEVSTIFAVLFLGIYGFELVGAVAAAAALLAGRLAANAFLWRPSRRVIRRL